MKRALFIFIIFLTPLICLAANKMPSYVVAPRAKDIKTFPCSKCHHQNFKEGVISTKLKAPHNKIVFNHMPEVRKCSLCHSVKKPDLLNLLDGTLVTYDESYKVCAQCHGPVAYDWKHGMHGMLKGHWDGVRTIYNCTICHHAHDPKFKKLEASPGPYRPKFLINKDAKEGDQ